MTVKEMMQKIIDEDLGDIDFCDDYDERAYVAYCGNHWSKKAEEKYARAFGLEVCPFDDGDCCVLVKCPTGKDAQALADLLYAMAGYIGENEYDELFPEPEEEPEPEPVRKPIEIVTTTGVVIKAKMVEIVQHQIPGLRIIDMDDNEEVVPVDQIVQIIGERVDT